MRLVYYKSVSGNFGDDLNLDLWPRLAPDLFSDPESPEGFSGIGTIIGMKSEGVDYVHVFTSGVGYNHIGRLEKPHRFWAVRGPLSAQLLGLDAKVAITDGALLSPLVFPKIKSGGGGTVVVPHWESLLFGGWPQACAAAGLTLVDPTQAPSIVLPQLANASLVLTESLHGAILADTYGTPWIPFTSALSFSTFKWLDWTRTVGIKFAPTLVPPPSALAAVVLGRPRGAGWGERAHPSESDISSDLDRLRSGPTISADPTQSLGFRVKRLAASQPLISAAIGFSPTRTAQILGRLKEAEPVLSSPDVRERLSQRLVERFKDVCRTAGVSPRL